MKSFKRIFILSAILLTICASLFSAEGDWWDGKAMTAFQYNGLQNVRSKTLDSLLSSYVGERFTDETFGEITSMLYAQEWLSWFEAEADLKEGTDDLVIILGIHENPYIENISFTGNDKLRRRTLEEAQNFSIGGFFNQNQLSANEQLVKDAYLAKGYMDSTVKASYIENEETNRVSIDYEITEGKQYKIRDILYEGISGVTSKELDKLMSQKKKSFFNAGNFQASNIDSDKASIISYYATKGYPDASITSVETVPTGEESDDVIYLNIVYSIEEGEMWTLGTIRVSGNEVFSDNEIENQITIHDGDVFDIQKVSTTLQNIGTLYYDTGYIRANINPTEMRDEDNHVISYDITISEGPQSIVEEVIISGLTKTKSYVFERELSMHVGDVFSRADYIKSQQNLLNTGLLKGVKAQLYPSASSDGVIVEYIVEEGNQMELQFGATFGGSTDDFPISGFLQWADKNLAGTGRNLSISTTLSPTTQSVSLGLSDNWVGDKRWSNGISFSVERSNKTGVLQKGLGSDYYRGRDKDKSTYPLGYTNAQEWYRNNKDKYPSAEYLMDYDFWRIALSYNTGYSFVWNPGTLTVSAGLSVGFNHAIYDIGTPYELLIERYKEKWQLSNKLSFGLTWDGRDLKQNTTKGYLLSMNYTYAGGFLWGLSNYNKLSFNVAAYHSLFSYLDDKEQKKSLVLSGTSTVSFMLPQYSKQGGYESSWGWYPASDGATKYEMLYLDGMNIGRGFTITDDMCYRSFMWNNQIELSFPLVYQVVALEGFISATGVTEELSDLSKFSNIAWYFAAGFGIKMQIPGFPLGLYLVKNASITPDDGFTWDSGYLFRSAKRSDSGMKIVLAITTSLY